MNPLRPFLPQGSVGREEIEDLRPFMGANTPVFAWAFDFDRGVIRNSWNWFTFMVPYFWCWYRKMPYAALLVLGVEVLLVHVLPTLGSSLRATALGLLALHLFCGVVGIGYYVAYSLTRVRQIRDSLANPSSRRLEYERLGGTSWPMVALGMLLYLIVQIVLEVLADQGVLAPLRLFPVPLDEVQVPPA